MYFRFSFFFRAVQIPKSVFLISMKNAIRFLFCSFFNVFVFQCSLPEGKRNSNFLVFVFRFSKALTLKSFGFAFFFFVWDLENVFPLQPKTLELTIMVVLAGILIEQKHAYEELVTEKLGGLGYLSPRGRLFCGPASPNHEPQVSSLFCEPKNISSKK